MQFIKVLKKIYSPSHTDLRQLALEKARRGLVHAQVDLERAQSEVSFYTQVIKRLEGTAQVPPLPTIEG